MPLSLVITYRRSLGALIAALLVGSSLIFSPAAGALSIGGPSDCDSNAIISCGAHSTGALMNAYSSSAYVRKVYAYFGISNADMANLPGNDVAGVVNSNGTVQVNGKTVANNAVTGGRQNIAGSTPVSFQGITFYKRPPSVSFQQSSLPAFVSMKNGVFQFAVIASCGNAVSAHPTSAPQKAAVAPARAVSTPQQQQPKPQAAPTQVQSQNQSQQVNVNNSVTQNASPAPQPAPAAVTPGEKATPAEIAASQQAAASLPNTGPTGVIGAFLAAVGLGTLGYRRFILRKLLD